MKHCLSLLIEHSEKSHDLLQQYFLESLWILSFNEQIAQEMRQNSEFIVLLKQIEKSAVNQNQNREHNDSNHSNDNQNNRRSKSLSLIGASSY